MIENSVPRYVYGDNLGAGLVGALILNYTKDRVAFVSVWKCIYKITLCTLSVLPFYILAGVLGRAGNDWGSVDYWVDILEMILVINVIMLPLMWGIAIYHCVVVPRRKFSGPMNDFISRYMPGATVMQHVSPTNYVVEVKGYEFEVVYTNRYRVKDNDGKKLWDRKGAYVVATYFDYREETIDEYFDDEEGYMRDEICEKFETLCSSGSPWLDSNFYSMWTVFDSIMLDDDGAVVEKAIAKMMNVIDEMNLKPLSFRPNSPIFVNAEDASL